MNRFQRLQLFWFITLLTELSHCKHNKDCSISFWLDSLMRPALEAAGEETVGLSVLASKMIHSGLPA